LTPLIGALSSLVVAYDVLKSCRWCGSLYGPDASRARQIIHNGRAAYPRVSSDPKFCSGRCKELSKEFAPLLRRLAARARERIDALYPPFKAAPTFQVEQLLHTANAPSHGITRKHPDDVKARAVELARDTRLTYPEIADLVGVSAGTIAYWAREAGLRRSKGNRRAHF
jgi:hypothetical protein